MASRWCGWSCRTATTARPCRPPGRAGAARTAGLQGDAGPSCEGSRTAARELGQRSTDGPKCGGSPAPLPGGLRPPPSAALQPPKTRQIDRYGPAGSPGRGLHASGRRAAPRPFLGHLGGRSGSVGRGACPPVARPSRALLSPSPGGGSPAAAGWPWATTPKNRPLSLKKTAVSPPACSRGPGGVAGPSGRRSTGLCP